MGYELINEGRKFYKISSAYIARFLSEKTYRFEERFLYSKRRNSALRKSDDFKLYYGLPEYMLFEEVNGELVEFLTKNPILPESQRNECEGLYYIEQLDHRAHKTLPIVIPLYTNEEVNSCYAGFNDDELMEISKLYDDFHNKSKDAKTRYLGIQSGKIKRITFKNPYFSSTKRNATRFK